MQKQGCLQKKSFVSSPKALRIVLRLQKSVVERRYGYVVPQVKINKWTLSLFSIFSQIIIVENFIWWVKTCNGAATCHAILILKTSGVE